MASSRDRAAALLSSSSCTQHSINHQSTAPAAIQFQTLGAQHCDLQPRRKLRLRAQQRRILEGATGSVRPPCDSCTSKRPHILVTAGILHTVAGLVARQTRAQQRKQIAVHENAAKEACRFTGPGCQRNDVLPVVIHHGQLHVRLQNAGTTELQLDGAFIEHVGCGKTGHVCLLCVLCVWLSFAAAVCRNSSPPSRR